MRLFIAIPLNPQDKDLLFQACQDLKEQGVSGRFVPVENYHLTLAFLGEVEDEKPVIQAMESLEFPRLNLSFDGALFFGPLLALRMESNPQLAEYVKNLRQALKEQGVWFDEKPFKGHITLIRKMQNPQNVPVELPSFSYSPSKVVLMKSTFSPGGMIYDPLFERDCA